MSSTYLRFSAHEHRKHLHFLPHEWLLQQATGVRAAALC